MNLFLSSTTIFTLLTIIIILFAHVTQFTVTFVGVIVVLAVLSFRMAWDVIER